MFFPFTGDGQIWDVLELKTFYGYCYDQISGYPCQEWDIYHQGKVLMSVVYWPLVKNSSWSFWAVIISDKYIYINQSNVGQIYHTWILLGWISYGNLNVALKCRCYEKAGPQRT